MDQIIYSEKVQKKSVYKNKFEQYCEAQRKQLNLHSPPPPKRDIATVNSKFRGTSPILSNRHRGNVTVSQIIHQGPEQIGPDSDQIVSLTRGTSIGNNKGGLRPILKDTSFQDGSDANPNHSIGLHSPGVNTSELITLDNAPSKQGTRQQSHRINMLSARPGIVSGAFKPQSRNAKGVKKSIGTTQKFHEHIRVPVQILASTTHPISYQKNFKEDETNNYNYNNILIHRQGNMQNNLSQEPSLSKIKTAGRKPLAQNKVIMSTNSPNGFGYLALKDGPLNTNTTHTDFGVQSADERSAKQVAAAATSQTDTKMSLQNAKIVDSANENDVTRSNNQNTVLTQHDSDVRSRQMKRGGSPVKAKAAKNVSVTFTESRQRKKNNNMSLFDNTSLDQMPSVLKTPEHSANQNRRANHRQIMSTDQKRGYRGPPINIGNGMGYVNYVNGVPVSIQLNERDLLANDGVVGRFLQKKPVSNWQQNLLMRNRAMQQHFQRGAIKSDAEARQAQTLQHNTLLPQRMNQTIMQVQGNQGQILPSIDAIGLGGLHQKPFKSKNVKPDYYKNRRKANFTNMFEVFDDETQTLGQAGPLMAQEYDSSQHQTLDPKRSIESDDRTLGTNQVTDAASHKYGTEKKRKGYFTEGRDTKLNQARAIQSGGRQSLPARDRNLPSRNQEAANRIHSKSTTRSPEGRGARPTSKMNAMEEVEKILPSPQKKLKTAAPGSRQSRQTIKQAAATLDATTAEVRKEPSQSKSKAGAKTAAQTKNLLKKAHDKDGNADLPLKNWSPDRGSEPLNLQIGEARQRRRQHWESPSRNVDESMKTRRQKLYPGANQHKSFEKMTLDPNLFKIRVMKEDLEHLARDDLDEISKFEVIYKILKDQLRNHQQKLIQLKEQEFAEQERLRLEREREELERQRQLYKQAPKTTIRAVSGYKDHDRKEIIQKLNKEKEEPSKHTSKSQKETVDLKEFVRHIRPFEWFGPQRDLSPELKRIVKNLTCQEHSYVYCPSCKNYDETDYDPMSNIKKFMKFIKQEQDRLQKYGRQKKADAKKHQTKEQLLAATAEGKKQEPNLMPDDSVSEITELEEEEILTKYYKNRLKQADDKLEPEEKKKLPDFVDVSVEHTQKCKGKKKETEEERQRRFLNQTIELELRQPEIGPAMHDEVNSAHQFSYRNISVQADSEERLEMEMKASAIDKKERNGRLKSGIPSPKKSIDKSLSGVSLRSNRSINLTPLKETRQSNGNLKKEDMLFKPWILRSEAGIQTEAQYFTQPTKKQSEAQLDKTNTISKIMSSKSRSALRAEANEDRFDLDSEEEESDHPDDPARAGLSPDHLRANVDQFKEDWCDSIVYKKAMKAESIRRGLSKEEYEQYEDDEDVEAFNSTIFGGDAFAGLSPGLSNNELAVHPDNSQDADGHGSYSGLPPGLSFLKRLGQKGNIQMLSEQEVAYVKTLLKQEAEQWENQSSLDDLYRHCKFTIRMLTRKMARIDNKQVFRDNPEINRESTLVMVYRADLLYQAKNDVSQIFKNLSRFDLDKPEFDRISQRQKKNLTQKDETFLIKREHLANRLKSQVNNFLSMYKLFNNKFVYKDEDIYDYLANEMDEIRSVKGINDIDKQNGIVKMSGEHGNMSNQKSIIERKKQRQRAYTQPPSSKLSTDDSKTVTDPKAIAAALQATGQQPPEPQDKKKMKKNPYKQQPYKLDQGSEMSGYDPQTSQSIKAMETVNPGPLNISKKKTKKKLEWTQNERM